MINSIIYAMSLGFSAGAAPGPTLAGVIHESSMGRLKKSIVLSATPLITDPPIILVGLFFLDKIKSFNALLIPIVQIIGILVILKLAISLLWGSQVNTGSEISVREAMLLNLTNPGPYVFWWTIGCPWLSSPGHSAAENLSFIIFFFLSILSIKMIFAVLVSSMAGKFMSVHRKISRGLGVVLLICAGGYLVEVVKHVL